MRALVIGVFATSLVGCDPEDTASTDETDLPPVAQIWINEFMASNQGSLVVGEDTPDWVELYNPGSEAVDLEGWFISDNSGEPDKHLVQGSLVVPAQGFLLLYADGMPTSAEHLPFKLSAAGEEILVTDPSDRTIDWVEYEAQQPDVSAARVVDGDPESGWTTIVGGTPGASNAQ